MKSRIVRPVRRQDRNRKMDKKAGGRALSDTQPMRTAEVRAGYAGYRKNLERRREAINTPRPQAGKRAAKKKR